jgi:hypothetical protein
VDALNLNNQEAEPEIKPWALQVTLFDQVGRPVRIVELIRVDVAGHVTIHHDIAKQIGDQIFQAMQADC